MLSSIDAFSTGLIRFPAKPIPESIVVKTIWLKILPIFHPVIHVERVNTLRPRQIGRHFTDVIVKCIFFNEHIWIPINISLQFVPGGPINNIPALVQS